MFDLLQKSLIEYLGIFGSITALFMSLITIYKTNKESDKLRAEMDKLKSDMAKNNIEVVMKVASHKREYNTICSNINQKVIQFNNPKTKSKTTLNKLRDEIDKHIFTEFIPIVNELSMINDYFLQNEFERRIDFIEDIIIPSMSMLKSYLTSFNSDVVLEITGGEKTYISKSDFVGINRFLVNTPNHETKDKSLGLIKEICQSYLFEF